MRTSRCTPISLVSKPVGEFAADTEGRGLDARLFARLVVVQHGLEAVALAQRRYMRISISAQSCDSVPPAPGWMVTMALRAVVLTREQGLGFEFVDLGAEFVDLAFELGIDALAFTRQLEVGVDVVAATRQVGLVGQRFFQPLALPHYLLRFFRIRPEVGVGSFLFQFS